MEHTPHSPDRKTLRSVLLWTIAFSLLAHGYRYLSLGFSGDAMLLSQRGEALYQISLGRFLQPVYWMIRGEIAAPLTIGLFATAFLCISAYLTVSLLGIRRPVHIALVCAILTANETMGASNAAYLPWTDVYMFAMALALVGVFLFFRWKWGFLAAPVLYCLSVGLYQSYLPAASTLIILVLLMQTLRGEKACVVWRKGLLACLTLLAGLLLYALVLRIVLSVSGAQASQDYNGVGRVGAIQASEILPLLLKTYLDPLRYFFSLSDTPVMTWHVSAIPTALNIAIFALCIPNLIALFKKLRLSGVLTALFLIAVLPLGMNFIQFIAGGIASGLTIYAYYFLYLIPLALPAAPQTGAGLRRPAHLAARVSVLLLMVLSFLNIRNANLMSFKRDLEASATISVMTRILDRAEQTEGYIPGETPVVLLGFLPSSMVAMERSGFEEISHVQGMRYTYAAAYETSTYWYLQMALGEPINLVSHEERQRLSQSEAAKSLPLFPNEGCCRMIDGRLYIRIS